MALPSFREINYAFRPAKHVQRKMLCEALHCLSRLAPLSSFRYVGFGSVGFHDFSLFHQRLGISDMVSIEADVGSKRRFMFNRPYSCIKMKWGLSYDVLPTLNWSTRTIVWLDYEHRLDLPKLGDIATLGASLPSGSVLLATFPVKPEEYGTGQRQRLTTLVKDVGEERVRAAASKVRLGKWGTARAVRNVVSHELAEILADRNALGAPEERVQFRQLFNFHYADGKRMLTVGGAILNDADRRLVDGTFDGLPFVRRGAEPFVIDTPILTLRELRYLDSTFPSSEKLAQAAKWIPASERSKYGKLYRHFPNYGVVES